MKLIINGKEEIFENDLTVSELLNKKNVRPEIVTIELNDKIIQKQNYGTLNLTDNDRIELVFFMGGGM